MKNTKLMLIFALSAGFTTNATDEKLSTFLNAILPCAAVPLPCEDATPPVPEIFPNFCGDDTPQPCEIIPKPSTDEFFAAMDELKQCIKSKHYRDRARSLFEIYEECIENNSDDSQN